MHRTLILVIYTLLSMTLWSTPAQSQTILVIGDSLSAAYNMNEDDGWVNLLQRRLDEMSDGDHKVINSSISGDTTTGGLSRLPAALKQHQPAVVVIELGANDGLRGMPLKLMRNNLQRMIKLVRESGATALLAGIQLPPNYGEVYTKKFHQVFLDLAESEDVAFIPFLLENIGGVGELTQADGMHPNARAQPVILDNVWPHLKDILD